MKKIYYTLIILIFYLNLLAEFTFQYAPQNGTIQDFQTSHICSDYGMRMVPATMTKWHKGVDFSKPVDNTHLLAIDGGTVNEIYINRVNWEYKTIEINGTEMDYGFGHIFQNGEPADSGMVLSGMRLQKMNLPYIDDYAIVYNNVAIGEFDDATATVGNDTLTVTDSVSAGQRIAPLGNSASGNYHVHLYCFKNGFDHNNENHTQDPLEFVDHMVPQYTVSIQGNMQDSLLFGDSSNHILVRCEMDDATPNPCNHYSNVAMNLDRVDLLIKSRFSNGDYQLIRGPYLESKIILGGRENTSIYPDTTTTNPAGNSFDIKLYERYGGYNGSSWNTGILPWAYRDTLGYPYDDYYFCDFILRIKDTDEFGGLKELAECNDDARYPDGKYILKAKAVTVRDSVYWSEPQELLIDNFVPYIKEVKIYSNGNTLYWGGWQWWDSAGLVYAKQVDLPARAGNNITIKVTASEPMDTLCITSIQPLNWQPQQHENVNEDRTEWTFRIPASNIPLNTHDGVHTITFEGTDLADNSLQIMQKENSPYSPASIPKRQSATAFAPQASPGTDSNHHFTIRSHSAGYINNRTITAIQTNASLEPVLDQGSAYILEDVNSLHEGFNFLESGYTVSVDNEVARIEPGASIQSQIYVSVLEDVDTLLVWLPEYDMSLYLGKFIIWNGAIQAQVISIQLWEYYPGYLAYLAQLDRPMTFPAHMYYEWFHIPMKYVTEVVLEVDPNASVGDYTGMILKIGNEEHRISEAHRTSSDEAMMTIDNDLTFPEKLNFTTGEYEVNKPYIRKLFDSGLVGENGNTTNTVNLNNGSDIDDYYNGMMLRVASSLGWGNNEEHTIIDYNGTTKIATVDGSPTWHLCGTPGYFIYDSIANGDIAYCDTLSGFVIETDVSNNEADDMIVYNLDDSLDYVWNDTVWVVNEYPELQINTDPISHLLNRNETVNDEFTINNIGVGELSYSANLMICVDSTFVDSLGDLLQGFDLEEICCGMSGEGFYATIETNGLAPIGFIFIDADCDAGTGFTWNNDGVNFPFGSMDKDNIIKDFSDNPEQDKKKFTNRNNLMGIDFCAILEYGYDGSNSITMLSFTNQSFHKEYHSINITENHYELSFPVIELLTANGCCDGNMDFFFTFVDESFTNKDFAPNSGSYGLRGSYEWISMLPVSSSIATGCSQVIDLTLSSENITSGLYDAFISMSSNDMFNPNPSLPVALEVIGLPDISANPMLIDFGEVEIGSTSTDTIRISNLGDGILSISNTASSNSDYQIQDLAVVIYPGDFHDYPVDFSPSALGQINGDISFHSNDPDEPQIIIPLTGSGVQVTSPPDPPQNVSVELSGSSVLINWDSPTRSASDRSISYVVYSSEFPDTGFTEDLTGTYTSTSWIAPYIYDRRFYYVCAVYGSQSERNSVPEYRTQKAGRNINRKYNQITIHEVPMKKREIGINSKTHNYKNRIEKH